MEMKEKKRKPKLKEIIALLEEKGYNPKLQIRAYLLTGDAAYITRHGGAREKIKQIDKNELSCYADK